MIAFLQTTVNRGYSMKGISTRVFVASKLIRQIFAVVIAVVMLSGVCSEAMADTPPPQPPPVNVYTKIRPCSSYGEVAVGSGADTTCEPLSSLVPSSPGTGGVGLGSGGGGGSSSVSNNSSTTTKPNQQRNKSCDNQGGNKPIEISQMAETLAVTLFRVPGEMGLSYSLYYTSPRGWYDNLGYWLDTKCGAVLSGGGGGSPITNSVQLAIGPKPTPCEHG